jgi:hypothetical protein
MYPLPLTSKTLNASKRLKSNLRANYFFISSISLSAFICYFKALTRCSSSLPFIGDFPELLSPLL